MAQSLPNGRQYHVFSLLGPDKLMTKAPHTNDFFPELAETAFRHATDLHPRNNQQLTVYDPFCGNGTVLTTLSVLHRHNLRRVIGSDINPAAVEAARQNIYLSSAPVILDHLRGKPTGLRVPHDDVTPGRLFDLMRVMKDEGTGDLPTIDAEFFRHDLLQPIHSTDIPHESVGMVVTDPPHGSQIPFMRDGRRIQDPRLMPELYLRSLGTLRPCLQDGATLALICNNRDGMDKVLSGADDYEYVRPEVTHTRHGAAEYKFTIHLMKAA